LQRLSRHVARAVVSEIPVVSNLLYPPLAHAKKHDVVYGPVRKRGVQLKIRLGIEAPREVPIFRKELLSEPAPAKADTPVLASKG
jgi:hypothetical protein